MYAQSQLMSGQHWLSRAKAKSASTRSNRKPLKPIRGHVPFTVTSLGQHTSIYAPDPRNVIHVVLEGVRPPEGTVGAVMPAFADTLSDAQIADIAAYLRARFSRGGEWQNIEAEIARLRRSTSP